MLLGVLAVLNGKLRAAVQASEAHYALVLDPNRLSIPHLDCLNGAFLCARSAADAGVLHMKM